MKFRDIQLLNSGKYSPEKLEQNIILDSYWENVRNQFCIRLPEKFEFLNISKLNIKLGNFEGNPFEEPAKDGIAVYKRDDYSFKEFMALSEIEKYHKSLFYIEDSLIKLCIQFNLESMIIEIIKDISRQIRDDNFEYKKIHKKTTKWHPSRKVNATTELYFTKSGISASLNILNKSSEVLSSHVISDSKTWEYIWYQLWKGYWNDNKFIIEDKAGKQVFEVNAF